MRGGSDPVYVMPVDGEDDAQQPLRSKMYRASFDLDTHNACCRRSFMGPGRLSDSNVFILSQQKAKLSLLSR